MLHGQTAWLLGTFNPIHAGHLTMATTALAQFGLQQVVLVPAGNSPWKHTDSAMTPCHKRVATIKKTIAGIEGVIVDAIECDWATQHPAEPTFSWYTLQYLKEKHAITGRIPIIMGSDTVAGLARWALPPKVSPSWWANELCIVQAPRQGNPWVSDLVVNQNTYPLNTVALEMPLVNISSTQLRGATLDLRPEDEPEQSAGWMGF
ncbi:MAG: nicotinate-nicotinamide nucleotide adenylyltransferase [Vampirovibrionales bacterium]